MHKSSILLLAALAIAPMVSAQSQPTLKAAFKDCFRIGAALNAGSCSGSNAQAAALIQAQFNSISPENELKWERIHPRPDEYNFGPADRYVAFGQSNGMFIVGHNLVWHYQTPRWVFQGADGQPADRETLLRRMQGHISTVVGRYKGKIGGWDVVNEALEEDGSLRKSLWRQGVGDDFILKAFEFAHAADPHAELYYNDYSLENAPKRKGAVSMIRMLQAHGIPVAGIGLQGHYLMKWPKPATLEKTIQEFGALGVKVMITELDMDVLPAAGKNQGADIALHFELNKKLNPYSGGLPYSVQQSLAKRYGDLFAVLVKHRDVVSRVTFWGVTDADSWLNNWPVRGRSSYPLLFDRQYQPKPAFDAVVRAAEAAP